MQTGLLLMPGALISGAMMPITGRLYDKTGPRILVVTGLTLLAFATLLFSRLNLSTSYTTIVLWILLRGAVMAFANMPAQTAALAVIPQELVGRASAMTNIIRSVSSSFGIAALTSILTKRMAFHAQSMTDRVGSGSIATTEYLQNFAAQTGGSVAATRSSAVSYLHGHIQQLSFVKGIDDVFIIAAILTIAGVVPSMFLKKGAGSGGMAMAAE